MEWVYLEDENGNVIWCSNEKEYRRAKRKEILSKVAKVTGEVAPVIARCAVEGLFIGCAVKIGVNLLRR